MNLLLLVLFILVLLLICACNYKNEFTQIKQVSTPFPIDIVYTWGGENMNQNDAREANCNELKYSLRSVFKYMPWINHIYIVINSPVEKNKPSWFNDKYKNKITLVDQNEIFPKNKHSELPCKVASIIYTYLHLVPKLSEHYIYFNDDFFVNKPMKFTDFYSEDGKNIHLNASVVENEKMNFNNKLKFKNYPFNFIKHHHYSHIPYAITKSTTIDYINEYSEWIKWVRSFPYTKRYEEVCQENGLTKPCQESHYPYYIYMYKINKGIIKENINERNNTQEYTITAGPSMLNEMKELNNNHMTFVIQSGTSEYSKDINKFLESKYPTKLYFEKN